MHRLADTVWQLDDNEEFFRIGGIARHNEITRKKNSFRQFDQRRQSIDVRLMLIADCLPDNSQRH